MSSRNNKQNKTNKALILVAIIFVAGVVILSLTVNVSFIFKKSAHEDAKRYATRHCLVFYPDNDKGKEVAKEIAKDEKNNVIYDYSLVPYGDYYLVDYSNGYSYYIDKENNEPIVGEIGDNGKKIISDYLRYTIKKQKSALYYDTSFLENTYVDNLDLTNVTYEFIDDDLICHFPNYEIDVEVPIKYLQEDLNMNFGFDKEMYVKPCYVDSNHPAICLTFDDGPKLWADPSECSTVRIVDTLYKYDATATFYVVGTCLQERDAWTDFEVYNFLNRSIANGNEYGSHTHGHENLYEISSKEKISSLILEPAEYMNDFVDYQMKTYRPPEGVFNDDILSAQPFPAILWDIDSKDWDLRDEDEIYNKIIDGLDLIDDGDIVIFHDIYDDTAKAIEKIVPTIIKEGYQLVTVNDLLNAKANNVNKEDYYYCISAVTDSD